MKILCLHHNDADGFGAAYALWERSQEDGAEVTYIPVQYGEAPPAIIDEVMFDFIYILDFSYKRGVMEEINRKTNCLVCIDHHKTAEAELVGLSYCIFDQTKSGAVLAWEYFRPTDTEAPTILRYVQDRDLWKFELPNSKAINAYIATLPWEFSVWARFDSVSATAAGFAILAFQKNQIEGRLKDVRLVEVVQDDGFCFKRSDGLWIASPGASISPSDCDNYRVPCVNASENISELGDAMCRAYPASPFSVSYCDRSDGKRSYSLRSRQGFDVSEVAKAFGGGGHAAAAGFTLDAPEVLS